LYSFDEILKAYVKQVRLPWLPDAPAAERVWIVWYDKSMQRRFTARLGEFENATLSAGHGWQALDIAPLPPQWLAAHEFFEALLHDPGEIRGLLPDLQRHLAQTLRTVLASATSNDVVALDGCASLFGFVRLSALIADIAPAIRGRMVVGFPGTHAGGVYRLLDARDGWNYHAVPIPAETNL